MTRRSQCRDRPLRWRDDDGGSDVTRAFDGRREDRRLVTGAGHFTADYNQPGQVYGFFLRSDLAHADIVSIKIESALACPGVLAILTGADTFEAGFKHPQSLVSYPGRGAAIKTPDRNVLALDRVRFVGEELALVVAVSSEIAQDAAELIDVVYIERPVVVDAQAALADGAPQLYSAIPGNLCFDFDYGDAAEVDNVFARAPHVAALHLESPRVVGNPMEPKACLASHDALADTYDVWCSSQGNSVICENLSAFTGVPMSRIRVHAQDVGGGFGIRGRAYPEYAALMLAAKQLGRPVKWEATRTECFISDYHGRAVRLFGELALDRDGMFLAIRHHWICNQGAYLSPPGPLINTLNPSLMSTGAYRIPAVYGRHRLALTNTTPITAYRGAGRPDMAYMIERLVDEAAHQTGVDRLSLR